MWARPASCHVRAETMGHRSKALLLGLGMLTKERGRFAYPGDGTLLAIWRTFVDEGLLVRGVPVDGPTYRKLRRILGVGHLPEPAGAPTKHGDEHVSRPGDPPCMGLVRNLARPVRARLARDGVLETKSRPIANDESIYVYPGDGTCLALWLDWCARGPRIDGRRERFTVYRRARRTLKVGHRPHPDEVLREVIAFAGDQRVTRTLIVSLIGWPFELKQSIYDRIADLRGKGVKPTQDEAHGTLEELLLVFPEAARDRIEAFLGRRRHPPILPPTSRHIGRVLCLEAAPLRILAACMLVSACAARQSYDYKKAQMANAERFAAVLPVDALCDADEVARAWIAYLSGETLPTDPGNARERRFQAYRTGLNIAETFADSVLGDDSSIIRDLLPARPAEEERLRAGSAGNLRKLKAASRSDLVAQVTDVVPRLVGILAATTNRLNLVRGLVQACLAELPHVRPKLEAGLGAGFRFRHRVIRPDGSLGVGEQVATFRFELESALLEAAYRFEPRIAVENMLPRGGRPDGLIGATGVYHDPANWRRIYVVYEGTASCEHGGEVVEPFLIELFRWGMLEPDVDLSDFVSQERRQRLLANGLPLTFDQVDGLLCNPVSRRVVARHARGSRPERGSIVVPLVEFYHAMCYAWLIVHYGVRWGARFAETQQIRLGPDCFRTHPIDGKLVPYLALKPKNWQGFGKFGLDSEISDMLRVVKRLAITRWFGQEFDEKGRPSLPINKFGSSGRDDLPPARYLFVGPNRMLDAAELLHYVNVLLMGILDAGSHIGRYLFATMLGLDGVGYDEIGWLLHHRPGSAMPAHYDLSNFVDAVDAARRFNANFDASLLGLMTHG